MSLSAQPESDVTVRIAWSDGDPIVQIASSAELTFTNENWSQPQPVTLTSKIDANLDDDTTSLLLTADDWTSSNVEVVQDDNGIAVELIPLVEALLENGELPISLRLKERPGSNVTVTTDIAFGATHAEIGGNSTVTFTPDDWDSFQTLTVQGLEDEDFVDAEVGLVFAVNLPLAEDLLELLPISDDDFGVIFDNTDSQQHGELTSVGDGASLLVEEGTETSYQVRLKGRPDEEVTLHITPIGGDPDITLNAGASLTFGPENWDTPQVVSWEATIDPDMHDGRALFEVQLAGEELPLLEVVEVDLDRQLVLSTAEVLIAEGSNATVSLTLPSIPTDDVVVTVAALGDTDIQITSEEVLTFTPEDWDTPRVISLQAEEDADAIDGITTLFVAADGWRVATSSIVESDNDVPGIFITPSTAITSELGAATTIEVSLLSQPHDTVIVPLALTDTTEANLATNSLRFTTQNWNLPQTVTINGLNDEVDDDDVPLYLGIGPASSTSQEYDGLVGGSVSVTNLDDDAAGIVANSYEGLFTTENGVTASVAFSLASMPTADVTISFVSTDTSEISLSKNSLVFTSSNWNVPQTLTASGVSDGVNDRDQLVDVIVGPTVSDDSGYDGLVGNTVSITNIDIESSNENGRGAQDLVKAGDLLFFTAFDPLHGRELWVSDGVGGSWAVKDINPGSKGSMPQHLTAIGETLYFTAFHPQYGRELWTSDGSPEGTNLFTDLNSGPTHSMPQDLIDVSGTLYFTADVGDGRGLWKVDDNAAVNAIAIPGTEAPEPVALTPIGDKLFFIATSDSLGRELWTLAADGSFVTHDIAQGSLDSGIDSLINFGSELIFTADDGLHGTELWKRDANGTLYQIDILDGYGSSSPENIAIIGNSIFFSAYVPAFGRELWTSDGTVEGTVIVTDLNVSGSSHPSGMTALGNEILFAADNGVTGVELWGTDGATTHLIKDINPLHASSSPAELVESGGILYFTAFTGDRGVELWSSDGSEAGTSPVRDINQGADGSTPSEVVSGSLYFTSDDGTNGIDVWSSDGTEAGTYRLALTHDDTVELNEDSEIVQIDVLANDTPDLAIVSVDQNSVGGEVGISADSQRLVYSRSDSFFGTKLVTYNVTDGVSVDQATVWINVTPTARIDARGVNDNEAGITHIEESSQTNYELLLENFEIDDNAAFQSVSIDWGDSTQTALTITQNVLVLGGNSLSLDHTYEDDGEYQPAVVLQKNNGTSFEIASTTVVVENVAPSGTPFSSGPITEGGTALVGIDSPSDASAIDAASLLFSFDFNNDGDFIDLDDLQGVSQSSVSVPTQYLSQDGTYSVRMQVADKDGGVSEDLLATLTIDNVAPTLNAIPDGEARNGQFSQQIIFEDPGEDAPWNVEVDWDDDGVFEESFFTMGKGPMLTHTFDAALVGQFRTVAVRVADDDDVSNVETIQVAITSPPLIVDALYEIAAGFVLEFNQPADVSRLDVFDSKLDDESLTDSELSITDSMGNPVRGSVVFDETLNLLRFVKSGNVLPDDTYTVMLASGSESVVAVSGAQLDGNGDNTEGDSYISTVTIANGATRVLSIGDVIRAPGQAIDLTPGNTSDLALPIRISEAGGVIAVDVEVTYDPAMMVINGVSKPLSLPADWSLTVNNETAGRLRLTASGVSALSGDDVAIFDLDATMASDAPYGLTRVIELTEVRVNGSQIPVVGDTAIQKAILLGDATGDRTYSGLDAALVSRVVADLDTGFDAHPLVDPHIIAAIAAGQTLSGVDAALISQQVVGYDVPGIPDLAVDLSGLAQSGVDPTVSLSDAAATAGGQALVTATLDHAQTGVLAFDFRIVYDTSKLDLEVEDLATGVDASSWSLSARVDDASGIIDISAYSSSPLTGLNLELLQISFSVASTASGLAEVVLDTASQSAQSVPYSRLNEGLVDLTGQNAIITIAPSLVGDYNNSGQVEQGDLDLVLLNWGSDSAANVPAGWINDLPVGIVDQAELDKVLLNWGNSTILPPPTIPDLPTLIHPTLRKATVLETGNLMAGDVNRDGLVSFSDFLVLSANYGKRDAAWTDGDLDLDGVVDSDDFVLMTSNFGAFASGV